MHNFDHLTPDSDSSPPKTFGQTLLKITIFAQKCFLSEKIKCIIVTISQWIRISHRQKLLVKLCGKSISRPKGCFLMGKYAVTNTNTNRIRNRNTAQNQYQYRPIPLVLVLLHPYGYPGAVYLSILVSKPQYTLKNIGTLRNP